MSQPSVEQIWEGITAVAVEAGLDPSLFGTPHHDIVERVATFLTTPPPQSPSPRRRKRDRILGALGRGQEKRPFVPPSPPVQPIIVCGVPGTGKTTFLYLLDVLLRHRLGLPDPVLPLMIKPDGTQHVVQKRRFNGVPLSLLSVRKWTDLLYFYQWEVAHHRLNPTHLDQFIRQTLQPMRVILADEVEIEGYSPTIPNLAKHGILVVGTSNQQRFPQLEERNVAPHIVQITGDDLRGGTPETAVVSATDPAYALFTQLDDQPARTHDQLPYRCGMQNGVLLIQTAFETAVRVPMLEPEWVGFFHAVYQTVTTQNAPQQAQLPIVLLLDDVSLDSLRQNYDAIIRYVGLFDVIEQLGVGVLLRPQADASALSRTAIDEMKTAVQNQPGIPPEIKRRALVGIDRSTSRLGQAAQRARKLVVGDW